MTTIIDGSSGVTFPDNSNQPKSGYGPAFSAYQSVAQSIPNSTFTKIQLQTEEFDTANAFDSVTNYRFQPLVAGYYQISGAVGLISAAPNFLSSIYKNGTRFKDGTLFGTVAGVGYISNCSGLIFLNGSTDYVELYGYQSSGAAINTTAVVNNIYFQGIFIRGA